MTAEGGEMPAAVEQEADQLNYNTPTLLLGYSACSLALGESCISLELFKQCRLSCGQVTKNAKWLKIAFKHWI